MPKQEICTVISLIFCLSIFQHGLIIPSLYFGFLDEDSECQRGTRGGLNLSDWIKGFGLEKLSVTFLMYITVPLAYCVYENILVLTFVGLGLDVFFSIAWFIWGIIILATNENNLCVAEGKGMAVMGIVDLVLVGIWFIYAKTLSKLKN